MNLQKSIEDKIDEMADDACEIAEGDVPDLSNRDLTVFLKSLTLNLLAEIYDLERRVGALEEELAVVRSASRAP